MSTKAGMYISGDCLVVPVRIELRDKLIDGFQMDILEKIQETRSRDVIIDLSGVSLMDTHQAKRIFDTGKMAELMGAATVFTGLGAGIAVSLIDLGFEPGEILTSISLEEGFELLMSMKTTEPGKKDEDGADGFAGESGSKNNE